MARANCPRPEPPRRQRSDFPRREPPRRQRSDFPRREPPRRRRSDCIVASEDRTIAAREKLASRYLDSHKAGHGQPVRGPASLLENPRPLPTLPRMRRGDFLKAWGLSGLKLRFGFLDTEFAPDSPSGPAGMEISQDFSGNDARERRPRSKKI